jgi:NAD(P)-dependent dehydrogenase (short-subunit alcohol dehydrogenase family)
VERPPTGVNTRNDLPLALIVGAGGMGMAAARRLGERNRVLLADIDEARAEAGAAALRGDGYDASAIGCDVTDPESVAAFAHHAGTLGPIRAIAHVAGLSPSMADWQTIMRVNLLGVHHVVDTFLPLAGQGTAVVLISSLAGHMLAEPAQDVIALLDAPRQPDFIERLGTALGATMTPQLAYQLSKYALMRLCRQRASAWGARGARIVSLSPGLIATPMGALEFERQPLKYDLLARTPIQREGTMLEIADAIEFLASDRASFISGTDLLVDGGIAAVLRHG